MNPEFAVAGAKDTDVSADGYMVVEAGADAFDAGVDEENEDEE